MRTHNIPSCYRKYIPLIPPDLALWFTLVSSNYPCLEHIFMIPKVFEPLKFYCNKEYSLYTLQIFFTFHHLLPQTVVISKWYFGTRKYILRYQYFDFEIWDIESCLHSYSYVKGAYGYRLIYFLHYINAFIFSRMPDLMPSARKESWLQ